MALAARRVDGVSFFSPVSGGDRAGLIEFLVEEVERLARAGADLAPFASNTPHLVFDEVAARAPTRLLSTVEAVADEAQARGFQTLGLLGARITVEADFHPVVFARRGLSIITSDAEDRRLVDDRYFGELVRGSFRDQTRKEISLASIDSRHVGPKRWCWRRLSAFACEQHAVRGNQATPLVPQAASGR